MIKNIIKSFFDLYHRISIRYTVFISFTLSALIAILMTGVTFYLRFSNQLESTQYGENQILIEQINQSLYSYLSNMIHLSDAASFQVVKNIDIPSSSVNEQLQLLYDANNNYIKNITLFSVDGDILATAPPAILKENVDVTSEPWFEEALNRTENLHFSTPSVQNIFIDSESQYSWTVSLSCAIEITENKVARKAVLLIDLKYMGITEMFRNMTLSNNGYVYLIDSEGTIIYHPQHQLIASGLIKEINSELSDYRDGDYTILTNGEPRSVIVRSVGYTGWKIIGIIPHRGLTFDSVQNIMFVLFIFFLYFTIIVLVNSFISNKLTEPIKKLEHSVQQAELDMESQTKIYTGGSYEIRQLGHSIQQMVDLMHKLTDDIVQEQIQKQKSDLNVLQAQINPHFLYNTLDIIVWMIEKGQPEDALKIVSSLARFFRLSLGKGKIITTVNDELEHVRNYLMIQQMRYKNKFTYVIDADEEALALGSIKLVLQPIVENAIYHGMDYMMDSDGEIVIRAYVKDGDLYMSVRDNGLGMTQDVVDRLLLQNTPVSTGTGIGLKNVHDRIGLYFGKKYGIFIESEPDQGTCITLHMPATPYDDMEGKIL